MDIEGGIDTNMYDASTLMGNHVTQHYNLDTDDERESVDPVHLPNTDRAAYWREVGHKVNSLPNGYPGRLMLETWADTGNLAAAAEANGLSRMQGRGIVARFLEWAGLPCQSRRVLDRPQQLAPVRILTREEIDRLYPGGKPKQ